MSTASKATPSPATPAAPPAEPSSSIPPVVDELPGSPLGRRKDSIKALEKVGTIVSGPILDSMRNGSVRFASLTLVTEDNTAKTFYFPFPYGKALSEEERALFESQVAIARFVACNEFARVNQQLIKQQIDFIESAVS